MEFALKQPRRLFCVLCTLLLVFSLSTPSHSEDEETTYSISLTKTAEIKEDIHDVGDKKVVTETHVVRKGEHIWQLLRERGLLENRNLSDVLTALKELNGALGNLDLIHPGQKIIIPLKIVPVAGLPAPKKAVTATVSALKDLDLENYTVKPGDALSRVVEGRYDIPAATLYGDYFALVKKLNPDLKDVDAIYPGQSIRLPIYSPQVVRRAIEPPPRKEEARPEESENQLSEGVALGLKTIFSEMGEDWVSSGQHFIPLKSGGQIDLSAKSFPVLNLRNGDRIIVDLYRKLPERMAGLIETSWKNYRVVRLLAEDTLRSAFGKVLDKCRYPRILKKGEPLELGGEIPLSITGDWVIVMSDAPTDGRPAAAVVDLSDARTPGTPSVIKRYLEGLGIEVIEYPPGEAVSSPEPEETERLEGGQTPLSLVKTLLDLTGNAYSTKVEIPIYDSENVGFQVVVKADFLLKNKGVESIIDLSGIDPELIPFLKEHDFQVLSLTGEMDPLNLVSKTLGFLGVRTEPGPHSFLAAKRDESRNIRITLTGVVFPDPAGDFVLATPNSVPDEIAAFLSQKKYIVLPLS